MTQADFVTFVKMVAQGTGLEPDVVAGWVYAEEGGYKGAHAGNPLNIGPGRNYGSAEAAARATVELLHHPRYAPILRAARGANVNAQIDAIARSPWDVNHYRGGSDTSRPIGTLLRGAVLRFRGESKAWWQEAWGAVGGIPGEAAGAAVDAVQGAVLEPVERAVHSAQEFATRTGKLALAYAGLTGAALFLFVLGLQLATGAGSAAAGVLRARAGAGGGAGVPF